MVGEQKVAKKKWIQDAIKEPGAFSAKAKRAGKTVNEYAHDVLKKGSRATTKTKQQARLALTLKKLKKKK